MCTDHLLMALNGTVQTGEGPSTGSLFTLE